MRKTVSILFALVLALSLCLMTAVPVAATLPGASTAPTANVSAGQTNALVMDFTIADGGDSLVAGTAPSAGTVTADGEDADWVIDSYDKTDGGGPFAWDNANDLLAIDDDADSVYTLQADTILAGVAPSAGTSLVTAAIAAWQGVATVGTVSVYDAVGANAWDSANDAIWVEGVGDDAYVAADDTLLAGTAPPDATAETGDGGKDADWTTINLYDAVGANAWNATVDGIIEDFHAGGTYSAAADTYVAGTAPADGTAYGSNDAFDADWGMDSYDAAGGGAWDSVADAIIIDADTNDAYLDQLNAITLKNTGSAADTSDISAVKVWAEDGTTADFQATEDTLLGSAAWDAIDSWDLSGLTQSIPSTDQRVYVTVDIANTPGMGDTIIMQVPTLADAGTVGAYDAGDEGLFFASTDDIGGITNANTQTITAGPIHHYAVSAIVSPVGATVPFTVIIQARDVYNNNITTGGDATENITITLGKPDAGATPTSTATTAGVAAVSMTMTVPQTFGQSITFTGVTSGKTGTSMLFDVAVVSGGGGAPSPSGEGFVNISYFLDPAGRATVVITLTSTNGLVTMNIPSGTLVLDAQGNPLTNIQIVVLSTPPPPPGYVLVGRAYDCLPDGATFQPAMTLTFRYYEPSVPRGANEQDLVLAYWDGEQWVNLPTTVDAAANTATVEVTHFTPFALLIEAPPEEAPPEGALPEETPPEGTSPEAEPLNIWIVVGIIAAVIVVGLIIFMLVRRRA